MAQRPDLAHSHREPGSETRPFFKTSEFIAYFIVLVGVWVSGAMSDRFDAIETWGIAAALTIGYMISRGIAKSGTRSHDQDPR